MTDTGQCRNQTTVNPDSGSLQSNEPLPKKVSTKDNGAMKEGVMEDTQRKGFVQAALDKSKKDIPTFGHQMSISGISYLIERLSYEQYLAVNEIGFGGFWAIRTNVIPKSLGMWLLENYDYCGSFLNLSNHRILEFTKEDVHATLGLPMDPKQKVVDDETTLLAKFKAFIQVVNFEKQRCNWLKFKEMDLVFFVILRKEHYFLLCFDMVRGKITIINNRILKTTVDEKYEECHHIMVGNFHKYMHKTLHPGSRKIKEFDIEYLELPWQDEVNVHDCSIFVMRHMDSYQGQDSSCWDAGFGKKNKEQYLRLLRPIYCARILMHPINKLRMTVSETAKKFFQQEQQPRKAI
ncbi:hypothetical protein Cgig2_031632 [Carnegiea gigantea]|uniref:Ubiquitin-like protease family profile domain-containing protein n=1 Tax=Carnegiea gigantea TaxID=171969 RepID=A0A9Q1K8K0_9CARY|nr:hypothetical protein Cgig2_031632 [Carnegiea gigantea]